MIRAEIRALLEQARTLRIISEQMVINVQSLCDHKTNGKLDICQGFGVAKGAEECNICGHPACYIPEWLTSIGK